VKHPNLAKLDAIERQSVKLIRAPEWGAQLVKKINADNEAATRVSFQIAREVAAAGKSFT
jgi:hypothetical protein